MKKTTTSNPLKFFNDAKAARNKSFSKSLIKAQDGRIYEGPLNETDIKKLDTIYPSTAPVTIPYAPNEANLIRGFNRFENGEPISNEQREREGRASTENRMRKPIRKTGGTHKMPNGKMMLNSAMKKKTFKKK